ncbi:octanoyltransferase [Vulcanibacillus modesticaldus]|uniref:Octanoyltransferase LipM n=2 Tax=Vulcanibacillus modesticaldus TaxID=337097 RepID=A0A1D2YTA8_9BACI|nr:octanoyltransferase [Vulcanibacillus modesticaldus]
MVETWRFIDFQYHSPAFNMALDEALLEWHSKKLFPPTIRFYGWDPPTLSIGYFQNIHKEIDIDKVNEYNIGLVRRLTGGRAVFHDKELTYSVIVSEDHPNMPKTVTEAYQNISRGLLEGFKQLGLNAYFAVPKTKEEHEKLRNPRSAICFDAPSWYELVVEGRKVAGSAQTRKKGVILQHGSILIDIDENLLFDLFKYPNDRIKERLQKNFKNKAIAINDVANKKVTIDEVRNAFYRGFEIGLNIRFEPYELTEKEKAFVEELAKEKYESYDWTYLKSNRREE